MKVLLVYPRFKYPTGDPPLGILYIASYLRESLPNVQVKLFDATFRSSFKSVKDEILAFKAKYTKPEGK